MPLSTRSSLPKLIAVAGAAALALSGCKPPAVPSAGGLVSVQQEDEQEAAGGLYASQPSASPPDGSRPAAPLDAPPGQSTSPMSPSPAASPPLTANPDLIPVDVASSRGAATESQGQPRAARSAPLARRRTSIRLSAGVALPQSLPTGTMMGMSVDYKFAGGLNPSSKYVWVISSEGGGDVEAEVTLEASGTLQSFVPNLRPEHRPFNSRIEEITPGGQRIVVSNVAPMQTSY